MMQISQRFFHHFGGSVAGLLGTYDGSIATVTDVRLPPAGTGSAARQTRGKPRAVASDRCQYRYRSGQPIARPLPPGAAAMRFVAWMRSQNFCGEYLWRDLLEYFDWFAVEEHLVPLPEQQRAMFAHELGKLCRRGQVRLTENGRRRRLTTYIVSASVELVAA